MRYEPRFTFVPFVWTAGVALVWLVRCDAWVWPVQLLALAPVPHLGPHFGAFVRDAAVAAGTVALILLAAFGAGATLLSRWLPEKNLFTALVALAVGLWIVSVATLLIGAFSVAATPCVWALALCWLLPWPRQFVGRLCESAGAGARSLMRRLAEAAYKTDAWSKLLFAFLAVAALLNLIGALAPPFEYDELEYHLGALAEYRRVDRIVFLPHNFYSNLPQLTEMLYLPGSDTTAKLLHWTFGLLSALAVYAVTVRLASRRVAVTAAALFYCLPFVQDLSMTARIDLATTFFATLAFGGLLLKGEPPGEPSPSTARQEPRPPLLWLAALAAGCAVATKWTAIPVVLVPCLVFVLATRKSVPLATYYLLLATVLALPWLLKNWLLAGNPVYPLWSDAMTWGADQAALFARKHHPSFDVAGLWQFVERVWRYSFTEPSASPLLLLAAPLVLVRRNVPEMFRRAAWLFIAAFLAWYLLTFRPWRFLFPAFPLAAMIGAWALCETRWTRGVAALVMAVGLTMMGVGMVVNVGAPGTSLLSYALGHSSRRDFVARMGGGVLEPVVWMNENLPATAKVLYVGEARAYYARHGVVWATAFDRFAPDATNGLTHVYVNFSELKRLHDGYGYPRGLDVATVQAHLGREIHRTERGAVFEWKK